jgi:hypothetical protein
MDGLMSAPTSEFLRALNDKIVMESQALQAFLTSWQTGVFAVVVVVMGAWVTTPEGPPTGSFWEYGRQPVLLIVGGWLTVLVSGLYLYMYCRTALQLSRDIRRWVKYTTYLVNLVPEETDERLANEMATWITESQVWRPPWLSSGLAPMLTVILLGITGSGTASFLYFQVVGEDGLWALGVTFVFGVGVAVLVNLSLLHFLHALRLRAPATAPDTA